MVAELQKRGAQAIVNIFETGRPEGEYGKVTLMQGDRGHLTYGRSQTTLSSGNLYLLIKDYCATPGAEFAGELNSYLARLDNRDTTLDYDTKLRSLLRNAGHDPVMQDVQDRFFDRVYWEPSVQAADFIGITSGLGTGVVYDSRVHGSWRAMRDRTNDRHGKVGDIDENSWIENYVKVRREWLANHSITILRKTVYRMDEFGKLIDQEKWSLDLPFYVRGVKIDEEVLKDRPVRVSAEDMEERLLLLQTPYMEGEDVKSVQEALVKAGLEIKTDGVFGPLTEEAVKQFQQQKHLTVDGIVGPATCSALGLE